eukprot:9475841-Pyramimonas_sp.AAC.1
MQRFCQRRRPRGQRSSASPEEPVGHICVGGAGAEEADVHRERAAQVGHQLICDVVERRRGRTHAKRQTWERWRESLRRRRPCEPESAHLLHGARIAALAAA